MAAFCTNCGSPIETSSKFCPNCGAALPPEAARQTPQNQPPVFGQTATNSGGGAVRVGVPAPGYSDRVNHPEILAAVKKNRKAAGVFSVFLVPLPLIGFVVYSFFDDKMELGRAAIYGAIVSAVFLAFALYGFIKERAANEYEATVIDKRVRETVRHNDSNDLVTEYITVARTVVGKKKKIVENDRSLVWAYNYLQVGDRFKYHPQFYFPYELYNKSKAPYIACVSCCEKNDITADRCARCNLPLIK